MAYKRTNGVEDRLLYGRDNLVVTAPNKQNQTSTCWVFQVIPGGWDELIYRPLDLRDQDGNIQSIEPETGVEFQKLYDDQGEDVLRIRDRGDNEWYLYHFSIAVQQPDLRVYPRIPDTQSGGGWEYLTADEPDPTEGDPYGYVPGRQMNYDDPPRALETVAFQNGHESNIEYGFYNESPENDMVPRLHVRGRSYIVKPYTSEENKRKVISGREPRTMVKFGTIRDSFEPNTPNEWDVAEIEIEQASLRSQLAQGNVGQGRGGR